MAVGKGSIKRAIKAKEHGDEIQENGIDTSVVAISADIDISDINISVDANDMSIEKERNKSITIGTELPVFLL